LAFKVSGEGTLQARVEGNNGQGGGMGAGGGAENDRPGGGLGPPIDAPDPLDQYRVYILGGFAVALVGGAIYISKRRKASSEAMPLARADSHPLTENYAEYETPPASTSTTTARVPATPPATRSGSMLLEGLKEELFQLEVERQQGQISQTEYEKTKAALDQTLQRALKRTAGSQT
jgi:hypothetical protein